MTEREAIFCPYQKRGPMAASVCERTVERVQFRRGHADIHGALCDRQYVRARLEEEAIETRTQVVVHDRKLARRLARVGHGVGRVAENHICQSAAKNLFEI